MSDNRISYKRRGFVAALLDIIGLKKYGGGKAGWGENDIGEDALKLALENSGYAKELKEVVSLSRDKFGWFAKSATRRLEYPWIAHEIGECADKKILDIGAGVSPLPLLLAGKGAEVFTVDNSAYVRVTGQGEAHWNEWGFLDYSVLAPKITSLNEDILSVSFPAGGFDCIYSVSVVEHMPVSVRTRLWDKIREWLKKEGKLLLTIDLIPGTDYLWNYNDGKVVEPKETHGDIARLREELSLARFALVKHDVIREVPSSRVDCMRLVVSLRP